MTNTNTNMAYFLLILILQGHALKLDDKALSDFMKQKAKIGLDDGFMFGQGGSGFERMNIACPRSILVEALERIKRALEVRRQG